MQYPKNPLTIEKWRLAQVLKISSRQLSRWLNEYYYDDLKELGYRKNQKYLTQKQLNYLFPSGIDFEYEN